MKPLINFFIVSLLFVAFQGWAGERLQVVVDDPYIEMHTGPGRGYPTFHVAERGETVIIHKQRTSWLKVETRHGQIGWVPRAQMANTLKLNGEPLQLDYATLEDYVSSRWELGFSAGDFDGAELLSVHLGYRLTSNITLQISGARAVGNFSDLLLGNASIKMQPFPEWRISPYFLLGAGVLRTKPSATLVQTEDRTDNTVQAGLGVRTYINRRMLFNLELRNYVALTSRDENEEVLEWKAGLSVFF